MGQPVVHWELWSDNPDGIADFYRDVFDWQIRLIPQMNYRLVETGGSGGINGGIMKPQAGPWPGKLSLMWMSMT
jgi:predicted enzyme related to lactoylglutathione lyase